MVDVSVVVPVYKPQKTYFNECVTSVLSQDGLKFELILVDDGNDDKSYLTNEILDDPRIRVHMMDRNMGQPAALNIGISLCKGKYVALLDADDIFFPDKLRKQFCYLEANPEIGMVYGHLVIKYGDGPIGAFNNKRSLKMPRDLASLYIGNYIARSSVMIRKDVLSLVGLQDEHIDEVLKGGDDWDYWLRLVQHSSIAEYYSDDPLIIYRKHQNNVSNRGKQTYAFEKKCRKKALLKPHNGFGFLVLKYLFLPRAYLELKISKYPAIAGKYQALRIERLIGLLEYPLARLITTIFGLNNRVSKCNQKYKNL